MAEIAAAAMFIIALCTDLKSHKIPNWLSAAFCGAGLLYYTAAAGWSGLGSSAAGALCGFVPMLVLYLFRGIGAGDVKLFGAAGALLGAAAVLQLMMYAILLAGAIGIMLLTLERIVSWRLAASLIGKIIVSRVSFGKHGEGRMSRTRSFPFMIAVVPAAALLWLSPL